VNNPRIATGFYNAMMDNRWSTPIGMTVPVRDKDNDFDLVNALMEAGEHDVD